MVGEPEREPSKISDKRIKVARGIRLNCQVIQVTVGPEDNKEIFYVHEDAICDRSAFFRNAMKPEWASQRPNPRLVDLPDDDAAAFALYLQWVYSRQLPIIPDGPGADSSSIDGNPILAYAYVLGERLMDIDFKNSIVNAYVLFARGTPPEKRAYPSNEEIRILYDGTPEGAPIRKLLIDIWCCRGKHDWLEGDADLPQDFLIQVTKGLLMARPTPDNLSRPWKASHVQYHERSEQGGGAKGEGARGEGVRGEGARGARVEGVRGEGARHGVMLRFNRSMV